MVEVVRRSEKGSTSSPRIKLITLLLPALVSPIHQRQSKTKRYYISGARKKSFNVLLNISSDLQQSLDDAGYDLKNRR